MDAVSMNKLLAQHEPKYLYEVLAAQRSIVASEHGSRIWNFEFRAKNPSREPGPIVRVLDFGHFERDLAHLPESLVGSWRPVKNSYGHHQRMWEFDM